MEIKRISPFLSVSPQIYAADIQRLAEQGFKTIINNRPDNESDDQPVLAFCRTGTRSTILWALHEASHFQRQSASARHASVGSHSR